MGKKKDSTVKGFIDVRTEPTRQVVQHTVGMRDTVTFTVGFTISASELHDNRQGAVELGQRTTWRLLEDQIDAVTVRESW